MPRLFRWHLLEIDYILAWSESPGGASAAKMIVMSRICRGLVLLLLVALPAAYNSTPVDAQPISIEFHPLQGGWDLMLTPAGHHVFRDSLQWSAARTNWWDTVITCDESGCHHVQAPQYSFQDSLIIAVSYGPIACSSAGGDVRQIVQNQEAVSIEFAPLTALDPVCLAASWLHHYYRVAKSDIPVEVQMTFRNGALDPSGYLPLAVGNVWEYEHYLTRPPDLMDPVDRSESRRERYRVVDAVTRSDTLWYVVEFQERSESDELTKWKTFEVRYDSTLDSVVGGYGIFAWLRCLGAPDGQHGSGPNLCWPFVSHNEMQIPEIGPEPVLVKSFGSFVWSTGVLYGLGPIRAGGGCEPCGPLDDKDDWWLRYALIGGSIYGTSIVHSEQTHLVRNPALIAYPNPTSGTLTVTGSDNERLHVFNLLGQRVRSENMGRSGEVRLSLTGLPTGFYLLRAGTKSVVVLLQ